MSGFDELQVAVERGEREAVVSMVKDALDGGTDPADILNDGLIAAMQAVGEKMEEGDKHIPLLHLFTNCLHRRNQAIIQNICGIGTAVQPVFNHGDNRLPFTTLHRNLQFIKSRHVHSLFSRVARQILQLLSRSPRQNSLSCFFTSLSISGGSYS